MTTTSSSSPTDDASADDATLCPYTLKPISSINRSELAVINPSECGHKCSLPHLVSYVHDANAGSTHSCPVCLQSKVAVICDGNAADRVLRGGQSSQEQKIVCLRYGPIHYYLSLKSTSSSRNTVTRCALSRIGVVLGLDVKHGMKIIHKGKVIYPAADKTNNDVSEEILSISSLDISKKRKKPSLVVMGVRRRQFYSKGAQSNVVVGVKDIVFAIVSMLTPRSVWIKTSCGLGWTVSTTKSLLGGVCIFVQSFLYPPQHNRDE